MPRLPICDCESTASRVAARIADRIGNRDSLATSSRAAGCICVLLLGVAIFIFPFVWMLATSMKTDEELTADRVAAGDSDFRAALAVRAAGAGLVEADRSRSGRMGRDCCRQLVDRRSAACESMKSSARAPHRCRRRRGSHPRCRRRCRDESARARVLNASCGPPASKADRRVSQTLLTPDAIADALADRLARLEVRGLPLRTLDAHIRSISAPAARSQRRWQVESGDGDRSYGTDGVACCGYDFDVPRSRCRSCLRRDFDFPARPERPAQADPLATSRRQLASRRRDASMSAASAGSSTLPTLSGAKPRDERSFPAADVRRRRRYKHTHVDSADARATASSDRDRTRDAATDHSRRAPRFGAISAKFCATTRARFNAVPFWRYVGNSSFSSC